MTIRLRWIALPLLTAVGAAAQTNAWDLGHPDAKLMMGINLKSLRESAVGQSLRAQMSSQAPQMGPAAMALGFLDQVDRIFLSSPALSSPRTKPVSRTAATRENPPFLVVVEGTLPVQQLVAFLPGTSHRYHSIDVYRGAKATDPSIAALDARTMMIGDEKSVMAAIDRRGSGTSPASATLARAKQLASTHDFWIIATDSLSQFQPSNANFPSQLAGQIKGLDMGFTVREGFQLEMSMAMESDQAAAQLMQLLSSQIALMQTRSPEAAEAVRKLQIGAEGNHLRASLSLSKEEFEQNFRALQAARAAAETAPRRPATPSQPRATQPPPPPGKIKIYGLDEGVREIQMTH